MRSHTAAVAALALAFACTGKEPEQKPARAEIKKVNGSTIEIAPTAGQLPFCLVFTLNEAKPPVIRQLTMNRESRSVPCEAGKPIGGVSYRIPVEEGRVRAMVFFSDRPLDAVSVGRQIYDISFTNPHFRTIDLRLPGNVIAESLDFTPTVGAKVAIGQGAGGADAGTGGSSK